MASQTPNFPYDAIVFHSDDDFIAAARFCQMVKERIRLRPPLKITTFEEFSMIGRPLIVNLEEAIDAAMFILYSEHYYYTTSFGNLSGQLAILEKMPNNLVRVSTGSHVGHSAVMRAFKGIQLQDNWEMSEHVLQQLKKLFSSIPEEARRGRPGDGTAGHEVSLGLPSPDPQEYQSAQSPAVRQFSSQELPSEPHVAVFNRSLSARSYTSGEQSIASRLDVANPSLSTESHASEQSIASRLDDVNPSLSTENHISVQSVVSPLDDVKPCHTTEYHTVAEPSVPRVEAIAPCGRSEDDSSSRELLKAERRASESVASDGIPGDSPESGFITSGYSQSQTSRNEPRPPCCWQCLRFVLKHFVTCCTRIGKG
ncbi:uncharacterized protein LOC143281987 [Babylonia areolata]|uniref:uncharacterized protein LOC143281987 n=1 Tax=Babylonia areolata TaxID=304850 RepID=UPI003FCFCF47